MERSKPYILGCGFACIDYIVVAPSVQPGHYSSIREFTIQGGGMTGTALVACSRLGARAKILGRVGDDEIGDQIIESLQVEGVDTEGMLRLPGGKSLFSWVHVDADTAERTIYGRPGSGVECSTDLLDLGSIESADVLLVDDLWPEAARAAVRKANECGVPVVCDVYIGSGNLDLVAMCDYAVIPESAALKMSPMRDHEDALAAILDLGPRAVVITCGDSGAYYADRSETGYVAAFSVDAVDTTGAGDVFHGAFAVGLTKGWGLRGVVTFSSAVSAIKCTRVGGRAGIPSLYDANRFLAERGVDLENLV